MLDIPISTSGQYAELASSSTRSCLLFYCRIAKTAGRKRGVKLHHDALSLNINQEE